VSGLTTRFLYGCQFELRHVDAIRAGCRLGSWKQYNTAGCGSCSQECVQEATINIVLYSATPPFFISMALILWDLRIVDALSQSG
jgi:hypothetical protein